MEISFLQSLSFCASCLTYECHKRLKDQKVSSRHKLTNGMKCPICSKHVYELYGHHFSIILLICGPWRFQVVNTKPSRFEGEQFSITFVVSHISGVPYLRRDPSVVKIIISNKTENMLKNSNDSFIN